MCIFIGQDDTIQYRYKEYGVDEIVPYEAAPRIRPNQRVNLVINTENRNHHARGNWGFNTGRFDWNARDDRLSTSPLWNQMWMHHGHHVAVPISRGYEATTRHGSRQWYAVKKRDDGPIWVAGLGRIQEGRFRTEWHVTLLTVDAGPVFEPIHDTPREIVFLESWHDVQTWLDADNESGVRALLKAADEATYESYRVHDDVFREKFPAEKCAQPFTPPRQPGLDSFDQP